MFYNGWLLFIAFMLAPSGIFIAERDKYPRAMLWMTIACGLYLLASGVHMAFDWADPFSARDAVPPSGPFKYWMVVILSRIWPFMLIVMGFIAAFIGARLLHQRGEAQTADRV